MMQCVDSSVDASESGVLFSFEVKDGARKYSCHLSLLTARIRDAYHRRASMMDAVFRKPARILSRNQSLKSLRERMPSAPVLRRYGKILLQTSSLTNGSPGKIAYLLFEREKV